MINKDNNFSLFKNKMALILLIFAFVVINLLSFNLNYLKPTIIILFTLFLFSLAGLINSNKIDLMNKFFMIMLFLVSCLLIL